MKRVAPKAAAIAGNAELGQAERVRGSCVGFFFFPS
jgi:hypothetical protein